MTFSVTLSLHQPTHLTSPPSSVSTRTIASYFATSQFPSNAHRGSRLVKAVPPNETQRWLHTQPLIDFLKVCEESRSIKQAKSVHGYVLKSNFGGLDLLVLLNHVTHVYSKCMDYGAALRVFDVMSQKNVFSYTVMIVASNEHGYYLNGMEFFRVMMDQGVSPDAFAFSAVMQSCVGSDSIELGEMVHAQVIVKGFMAHLYVSTSLLNMYAKLGRIDSSSKVFSCMTELNDVSWNAMISGFNSNGQHLQAFDCFIEMIEVGETPNNLSLVSVSKAVGQSGDINRCHEVHRYATQLGLDSSAQVGTALIDMYSKCGSPYDARLLFDSKFAFCEINTPWNAMITGYSQSGSHQEALELFIRMCQNDVKPDIYTFCSVFNAVAALKCLKSLREIHGIAFKYGIDMMHPQKDEIYTMLEDLMRTIKSINYESEFNFVSSTIY
ncbi:hypothetical protein L6164_012063 [Bauhinia variegata]|uniref:Uncharacterized protein n=1 Tax=Bauhinia variegata TaxID=167791 RepID=A0ACB9P7U5_BAUVA|nr:hypothetical protein L6164_012063 [Bauhinia variegata]